MTSTPIVRLFSVDQQMIDGWAEVSGDYNPLHVNPEFARTTRFGGTIAHGHIALALMEGLMLDIVGEQWLYGGRLEGARFRAPVRPGARYELLASLNDAGGWDLAVREEGTETVCVSASAARPAEPT